QADPGLTWGSCSRNPDGSYLVRTILTPGQVRVNDNGEFVATGRITTSHPVYKEAGIRVTGRVRAHLEVLPRSLYVGSVNKGEKVVRSLKLQRLKDDATVSVHSEDPSRVRATLEGDHVNVEVIAPADAGVFRTALTVAVPEQTVRIPILGVVR